MRTWFLALLLLPATARAEWGLGLRTSAQAVTTNADTGQTIGLWGAGLQVRWGFARRWGLELESESLAGDAADGAFHRKSRPVTLSVLFHFTPASVWDLYGVFGFGGTRDTVTFTGKDGMEIEQDFAEVHLHLGVGLERRFGHLGVAAELRAITLAREDKEAALPADAVPPESTGAQLNLAGTYYF